MLQREVVVKCYVLELRDAACEEKEFTSLLQVVGKSKKGTSWRCVTEDFFFY